MVEFVVVLLAHRNCTNNKIDDKDRKKGSKDVKISPNYIDIMASIIFPVAYILFNIGYWSSL
jgi:hypothetical protein